MLEHCQNLTNGSARVSTPTRHALTLAASLILLGACQSPSSVPDSNPTASAEERPMVNDSSSQSVSLPADVSVSYRPDGTVRRMEAADLSSGMAADPTYKSLMEDRDFSHLALYLLEQYSPIFKLGQPAAELKLTADKIDSLGYRQVRFQQIFNKRQVIASSIVVHFNSDDIPYLIQGDYIATPSQFDSTATLAADAAHDSAAEAFPDADIGIPRGPGIWLDDNRQPSLVYVVPVERSIIDKSNVLVDAHSGSVLIELPATYAQSL